jgi:putative PEP-CTERM system TPR-repeat lipoprotein
MQASARRRRNIWIVSGAVAGTAVLVAGLLLARGYGQSSADDLVAKASAERAANNLPAALIDLKDALQQDPKNLAARLLYAQTYIDLADGVAAVAELVRAQQDGAKEVDLAKPRAEAELLAGRFDAVVKHTAPLPEGVSTEVEASLLASRASALLALGKTDAALAAMEKGLSLYPHSIEGLIVSARASVATGDPAAARRRLAVLLSEAPQDLRVMRLQGDIAFAGGDYAAAEKAYRRIVAVQPWNRVAWSDVARTQIAANKPKEAIAILNRLLAKEPKNPTMNYLRALAAYRQNDFAAAYAYTINVLAVAYDFAPAQLIAGASSYALGQYEQSGAFYLERYVDKQPGDVLARKLLAGLQMRLGKPAKAVETLSSALNNSRDDPQLFAMIGVAAARGGDMVSANRYLKAALQKQPDDIGLREELGKTDVALGDAKAGIEEFEKAVKADPKALGPQRSLFLAYLRTRELDKALAVAKQAAKSKPNNPAGFDMMAVLYFIKGDREAARAALMKARAILRSDFDADSNLAKLALADGKVDEARQYYLDILKDNPKSSPTYRDLAALESGAGRPDKADSYLANGLKTNPDDPLATGALALHRLAQGKPKEAAELVERVLPKWPRDPVLLDLMGQTQLALGQAGAAASTFENLVGVAPVAALAHRHLAEAYLAEGKPETAIAAASEAVKLDPKDKASRLSLARALIAGGQPGDARKVIDDLEKDDPGDIRVSELDGVVAQQQGRLLDAIAAFRAAVARDDNAFVRRHLAEAQFAVGRPDDAVTTLRTWLSAHPGDADTRQILAELYVRAGRIVAASEQFAELVKANPKNAAAMNNLAEALSRLDRPREALAYARQAVALAPDSAETLDTFGTILLQNGIAGQAVASLDRAEKKSPDRPDIQVHLAQALAAAGKVSQAREVLRGLLVGSEPFKDRDQGQKLLKELGG